MGSFVPPRAGLRMTKGLDSEEDDESGFFVILKERIATEEST